MLFNILIVAAFLLGIVAYYLYFIAPKLNPFNRAESFLNEDKIEEAITEYIKILDKAPYDISVHKKLADLYLKQGKEDLAMKHLERLVDINRFTPDIVKSDIYRTLGRMYLKKGLVERAFEKYYEILKEFPADSESLYHVGFISLGQELFETAYKYLEKLAKQEPANFEILFGAGIAALQSQRISEAANFFKDAFGVRADSDIAALAAAFAFYRKRDYNTALHYTAHLIENSSDDAARFIANRLAGFIYAESNKPNLALKHFEDVKNFCIEHGWDVELITALYDAGFAALIHGKTELAYDYWNQLYQMDRNFKDTQELITRLRKEMDSYGSKYEEVKPVINEKQNWIASAFPDDFIWNLCGLKSDTSYNIAGIISSGKSSVRRDKRETDSLREQEDVDFEFLYKVDSETFRSMSYRACEKMGFIIDDILQTYRESDGVDFLATNKETKQKTLIWVRRWKGTNVGEIPLRNFAQAINDAKAKQGYFFTTSPLTPAAEGILKNLEKVSVVYPYEFLTLLQN